MPYKHLPASPHLENGKSLFAAFATKELETAVKQSNGRGEALILKSL